MNDTIAIQNYIKGHFERLEQQLQRLEKEVHRLGEQVSAEKVEDNLQERAEVVALMERSAQRCALSEQEAMNVTNEAVAAVRSHSHGL